MGNNVFTNNAVGQLAGSITAGAVSLTVGSGEGALFPNPSGSQYFYATIFDGVGNMEIVKVTARSTNTFTIVRGQDGTIAQAWDAADYVELRPVAASMGNFGQIDSENTWAENQTFSGDVAAATATVSGNATVGGTLGVTGVATFTAQPLYGANPVTAFPSGTKMLFGQAAAPTGWTGINTYNDYALRLVNTSGATGGSTGGSTAFTSVFTARTILQSDLPNVTLSVTGTTSEDGLHSHTYTKAINQNSFDAGSAAFIASTTDTTSEDGLHTHIVTGDTASMNGGVTQTDMDFAVFYQNVIMASKD